MTDDGPPVAEYRTNEVALGLMLWWMRATPDGTLGDLLADAALEGWIVPLTEFSDQDAAHLEYTQLKAHLRELEAVLREFAAVEPVSEYGFGDGPECAYCTTTERIPDDERIRMVHKSDCPWAAAKALVGEEK